MTYDEAMLRYGSDKPDLRFGLEIADLGGRLKETEFRVFKGVLDGGGVVRGFNAGRARPPADADELTELAKRYGAGGRSGRSCRRTAAGARPSPSRSPTTTAQPSRPELQAKAGDLLLIVADTNPNVAAVRSASCAWRSRAATT